MNTNAEFVTRMQSQLKKWDSDLVALNEEGKKATVQVRAAYDAGAKSLQDSRDSAQKLFQQICTATESAGIQLHAGMEGAWTTMQNGLAKATEELKK